MSITHWDYTGLTPEIRTTLPAGTLPLNDLEKYFLDKHPLTITKWWHYFEIYDRYFSKYRGKDITILEIGVFKGGSLHMWKEYFGPNAKIYGIDINPGCKVHESENVKIFIGSQSDPKFLKDVIDEIGPIDILIDDGGHTMEQQITSFDCLYHMIKDSGVYLCEDLHTSYWDNLHYQYHPGGGLNNPGSFIEMSKKLIDKLNHWHCKDIAKDHFTNHTYSMHYYDSVLVIEKRKMIPPFNIER